MRFSIIIAILAALSAASPIVEYVERSDRPASKTVKVTKVSWAGTGCPAGSVAYDIGEDGTVVALSFDRYVAQTGGNVEPKDARKNCNVRMTLDYPPGWSYTVASTILRGGAKIPKNCEAVLGAKYFFSGQTDDAKCSRKFKGPFNDDYIQQTAVDALVWSKCGVKGKEGPLFNVNSEAKIDCKDAAYLGVDTQDTRFEMKLLLQWKKC